MTEIRQFLCENIDKSLIRSEWEKWFRSLSLYLQSEDITDVVKKKNKLLHLGGPQLQEVVFNIPGALVDYDEKLKNDVFKILVDKLDEYFSPKRNSTFERHLFRNLTPAEGEDFNKFLLRLRHQGSKCNFGSTPNEIREISIKDKIIDSWAPIDLKKKLLEKEQSLDDVISACQIHEQITKQSQSMLSKPECETVNRVSTKVEWTKRVIDECGRCGNKGHLGNDVNCPARKVKCNKCGLIGHFARKCKTKNTKRKADEFEYGNPKQRRFQPSRVRCIEEKCCKPEKETRDFDCFKIDDTLPMNEMIRCSVGGCSISMIIDSGSRFNLLTQNDYEMLQSSGALLLNMRKHSVNQFKAYAANQLLKILSVFEAPVSVRDKSEIIATFYVIENGSQSLLGRDTAIKLKVLKLGLMADQEDSYTNNKPFPKFKNITIRLAIDETVQPVQQPLRRIPVALEEKVENKIKEALTQDIIEPVSGPSSWISPIVAVFKEDGEIRLCVDMRRANQAVLRENYPLPTFDTFMTKLRGAKLFSRLDLKWAYHQLELHESSRDITTFITHKGLFRYKRLMFGISSAPEIFQRIMEELLSPCSNALNYIDDVIIFGNSEREHDEAVKQVLQIFKNNNILLNDDKSVWRVKKLKFLGHVLSDKGISPDPDKIKTILGFRAPQTKEETRSFLGLVTYVAKFIPDMADITEPLRSLLKLNCKFVWGQEQQESFNKLKSLLADMPDLAYFSPQNKTRVIADASPVALGAVLIQFDSVGDPRIISFAGKSLSDVEKRYSQTEKESLALVWAVERFYYYLVGLEFELVTDHKPLEAIFKPTSKPPARIERWLLRLQSFKFKVVYRSGKENIADSISRLCKIESTNTYDENGEHNILHIMAHATPSSLSICEIAEKSSQEEEILEAIEYIKNDSWPLNTGNSYYPFRYELSTVGSIMLRGTRIVVPKVLRAKLLQLAHEGHPGESAMKRRVRSKVWWPLVDREVESFVKNCWDCLLVSQPNNPTPMKRHSFPNGPWQCVATDLLGPLPNNDYIFVLIDYYSRYQEVKFLRKITSEAIITILREIFCRLGIPKPIRADNGRQYVSAEFRSFCKDNNIILITTPPYWPQANGEVENMNRSLVKRLKIAHSNKQDYKTEIQKFLMMYNVTPHGTTGSAPTELMFNRVIRDKIPGIQDITDDMLDSAARDLDMINKQKGKDKGDKKRKAKESDIVPGDRVLMRNVVFSNKLTPTFDPTEYEVVERDGNEVKISGGGKTFRRNISHIKKVPSGGTVDPTIGFADSAAEIPKSPVSHEPSNDSGLRLKLKNIGGMWRPASEHTQQSE